jgi:hypothetical protein
MDIRQIQYLAILAINSGQLSSSKVPVDGYLQNVRLAVDRANRRAFRAINHACHTSATLPCPIRQVRLGLMQLAENLAKFE